MTHKSSYSELKLSDFTSLLSSRQDSAPTVVLQFRSMLEFSCSSKLGVIYKLILNAFLKFV